MVLVMLTWCSRCRLLSIVVLNAQANEPISSARGKAFREESLSSLSLCHTPCYKPGPGAVTPKRGNRNGRDRVWEPENTASGTGTGLSEGKRGGIPLPEQVSAGPTALVCLGKGQNAESILKPVN